MARCTNGVNERSSEFEPRLPIYFELLTSPCSCLAHVINLATQALIATYSKSPHFDPKNPKAHIPTSRDEVGLVRAIVVKVQYYIFYWHVLVMTRCRHAENGSETLFFKTQTSLA